MSLTLMLPLRVAVISPIILTTSSYLQVLSVSQAASLIVMISLPRNLKYDNYGELLYLFPNFRCRRVCDHLFAFFYAETLHKRVALTKEQTAFLQQVLLTREEIHLLKSCCSCKSTPFKVCLKFTCVIIDDKTIFQVSNVTFPWKIFVSNPCSDKIHVNQQAQLIIFNAFYIRYHLMFLLKCYIFQTQTAADSYT